MQTHTQTHARTHTHTHYGSALLIDLYFYFVSFSVLSKLFRIFNQYLIIYGVDNLGVGYIEVFFKRSKCSNVKLLLK